MKLKFSLLGIITLLSCASCSLLEPTVEEDEYGNKYTTNILYYLYRWIWQLF